MAEHGLPQPSLGADGLVLPPGERAGVQGLHAGQGAVHGGTTAHVPAIAGGSAVRVVVITKTINPLNHREHWRARAARVRSERAFTWAALIGQQRPALPCVVTMTRVAPSNGLDCDSLPASCKGVRDEIAKWLGVDDRDPRVAWKYEQRRGIPKQYAVEVHIA